MNNSVKNFIDTIFIEIDCFREAIRKLESYEIENWHEWKKLNFKVDKSEIPSDIDSRNLYEKVRHIRGVLNDIREIIYELKVATEEDSLYLNYLCLDLEQHHLLAKNAVSKLEKRILRKRERMS